MTTQRVFFGKIKTVVNQFELAAMRKTKNKSLEVFLKNGTKLVLEGDDAASVWGDWKKAMQPNYDPDFDPAENE